MATKATRIYAVFEKGEPVALVRAGSQAQAVAHVVGDRFEAVVADQDHCVALSAKGFAVQTVGAETA